MKHLYKLSLLLLALLLPATAHAHDFYANGIYYIINGNEASVTFKGTSPFQYSDRYSGSVTIPATVTYGGTTYSVTSIGDDAFYECSDLTSVTIPYSVNSIGSLAFSGCSSLTSIEIPNSVAYIGSGAFSGTAWFQNQPDGLVYAGLVAYSYKGTMPNGTSIILRDGTRSITDNAFSGHTGLTSIVIPNSVISIGNAAFSLCESLTNVTIGNSVTSIGEQAFSNCSNLTSIVVATENPTYDSRNSCNAIIETASNTLIVGCMNTAIPNSVATIGNRAFYGCTCLASIDIPNSVTSIGEQVFSGCINLRSIIIPNSVITIGNDAFLGTAWYDNQPDGVIYVGLIAYKYKGTMPSGTIITIKEGTLSITAGAFSGCSCLTSIIIPNSVISIGNGAFGYCSGLTSLTIGNSVSSIGWAAFEGCCHSLTSIQVASGNPTYDSRDNCNAIIETNSNTLILGCINTVIPNSVITIDRCAFYDCSGLTSITIPNSVSSIGESAFEMCENLTSITIGNSVISIDDWAFSYCWNLTEIYSLALIPPIVERNAFYDYSGATLFVPDIALNSYQSTDYWNCFTNIVGMPFTFEVDGTSFHATTMSTASVMANSEEGTLYGGEIVIPDSVTYEGYTFAVTGIESSAFEDCYELTSVVIPNSVTDIGEQAFQGCTGLTSLTIGSGVTAIGAKAFNYCNALETVKCLGTVPPVMASTDCFSTAAYNRATLLVPRQFVETYQAADYWYKFAHIDGWGSAGRGDIDGDGVVSINDVTRMIDAILNSEHEGIYFESADLNLNGRLDIGDVTTIIDMLLNGE